MYRVLHRIHAHKESYYDTGDYISPPILASALLLALPFLWVAGRDFLALRNIYELMIDVLARHAYFAASFLLDWAEEYDIVEDEPDLAADYSSDDEEDDAAVVVVENNRLRHHLHRRSRRRPMNDSHVVTAWGDH